MLTFHRCINYGSYWQARGLVEGLRAKGYDAVLLDYPSPLVETRLAQRPTLPTPVPREDIAAYKRKTRKFLAEFEKLPLSRPFRLDCPETIEPFDTVVIGSDEVWNLRHPWYAGIPLFWGQGLNARRIVSYAASFGNYSCWDGLGEPFTGWLSSFDALSVRDENSWWMLHNTIGRDVETVLDPALQFPMRAEGDWGKPSERYALVYGHNFSTEFARGVRKWASARGLKLLSIGYRNDWADELWLDAGPHDFAHAVAGAECVATNFFHGCVFALRNTKPFACELSPYRSIKVRGLLELLGGLSHLLGPEAAQDRYDALLGNALDPAIEDRIVELRRTSNAYLDAALSGSSNP